MRPKMTLSEDRWSELNLDQKQWAEVWSWGFNPSTDKTEAISTQSSKENSRGTKHVFENNLTAQWAGLHIVGALGLRICEIVYGLRTRSGLALALAVYSVHLKT